MAHQVRYRTEVDEDALMDLLSRGCTQKEVAEAFNTSPTVISKRVSMLQRKHGVLLQYRSVQSLELTEIQAKVLAAITPEKIADAPLRDLIIAFKILKDKEHLMDGKPTELKGLVGYLMQLEKEEFDRSNSLNTIDVDSSSTLVTDEFLEDGEDDLDEDEIQDDTWIPNL
jgi:hypothetical protein